MFKLGSDEAHLDAKMHIVGRQSSLAEPRERLLRQGVPLGPLSWFGCTPQLSIAPCTAQASQLRTKLSKHLVDVEIRSRCLSTSKIISRNVMG